MIINLPNKAYLSNITVTNIYHRFSYEMAAKNGWNKFTSLSPYVLTTQTAVSNCFARLSVVIASFARACDSDGETRPRNRNALWTFIWPSTDRIKLSVLQNISQNAANVDRHDYTGWPLRLELKLSSLYFIYPEVQIKRACIQCDSQQSGRVHFRSALATAPYKEKGRKKLVRIK